MRLTNEEAFDMIGVYFECMRNTTVAARVYATQFPGRRHYTSRVFRRLVDRLRTTGSVHLSFQESSENFVYEDPLLVSGVLRAVVEEDLEKIKILISDGKSVNINDNHGNTPLHVAVIRNLQHILSYLLTLEDVVVNSRNFYGETPLFQAVKRGHLHLAKELIKANCNVNLSNFEDITPLHLAVKYPEITLLLIESGANVNAIDYSGETPLHEAVSERCVECVCMLLYYNADPNIECDNIITPFMKSIMLENEEIQGILLDYVVDFNTVTKDGMTILNLSLTHTCPYVKDIIDKGADINYEHSTLNAFIMCLQVPNIDNFKLIWKKFRYQKLYTEMSYLELLLHNLDGHDIYIHLREIINSGNMDPIFEDFEFYPFYDFLDVRVPDKSVWLDITAELLCVYLSHGYSLKSNTLDQIYGLYGYCNLLNICLHMDIQEKNCVQFNMAKILYTTKMTVDDFKLFIKKHFDERGMSPPRVFIPFIRMPCLSTYLTSTEEYKKDLDMLGQFPSLLELSRNKTRDYIVNKFNLYSSKQYYLFVRHLPTHNVYKDILTFKKPVYCV